MISCFLQMEYEYAYVAVYWLIILLQSAFDYFFCKQYLRLIEFQIFKHTPVGHPDHQNLQEALNKATELCNQVNEGVREKENSDRLEWVQTHVHCDGLAEVCDDYHRPLIIVYGALRFPQYVTSICIVVSCAGCL